MHRTTFRSTTAVLAVTGLALAACGSDDDTAGEASGTATGSDVPTIVVTTNVLGDVVADVVGDQAEIITVMPVGADPHDFQASAQEVDALTSADALIVNGAGFEEGLLDVIESAESDGVPTFEAISAVDTLEYDGAHDGDHEDEDHKDEDHEDEDHEDEDHEDEGEGEGSHDEDHDHTGADPHFFVDPVRMGAAVEGIVGFLQGEVEFADPAAVDAAAEAYLAELDALDSEVAQLLDPIPPERRVLVTNHEVLGYFADRYDFEIVGAVIPGGGTTDSASAGEIADLAATIEAAGVPLSLIHI